MTNEVKLSRKIDYQFHSIRKSTCNCTKYRQTCKKIIIMNSGAYLILSDTHDYNEEIGKERG